jgi:hypothetical protein
MEASDGFNNPKLGSGSGYRRMNNQNRVRGGGFKRVNMTVQTQVYWVGGHKRVNSPKAGLRRRPQKGEQLKLVYGAEATEG